MKKILFLVLIILPSVSFAATQVSRYVDTDCANNGDGSVASPCAGSDGAAGPYKTLDQGRADIFSDYANFVSSDVKVTVYLDGATVDGAAWFTSCPTMDATRYLEIRGDSNNRAGTSWSTSKYRIAGNTITMKAGCSYLVYDGFQIQAGNTDDNGLIGTTIEASAGNVTIRNMLIRKRTSTPSFGNNSVGIAIASSKTGPDYIYNNVIIGFDTDSGNLCIDSTDYASSKGYIYNNTLVNCVTGIEDGFSDLVAKNNIVQNATTCYSGSFDASSEYNLAECASAPGTDASTSATVSFTNEAGSDFSLASGDTAAKNTGKDLSADANLAFSTDIVGTTRTGTWDRGAFEEASATPTPTPAYCLKGQN